LEAPDIRGAAAEVADTVARLGFPAMQNLIRSSHRSTRQHFRLIRVLTLGLMASALAGCTTRTQVFEGYSDDQLWTAMVATANAPEYDDWRIRRNEVFVDDDARRIEVFRILRRTFVSPHAEPSRQEREWRFEILLARDEELQVPMVDFTARQISVPAHVWQEADRYFAQMRTFLGPVATPSPEAAETVAEDRVPMPPPLEDEMQ
jgi:hypothetical protein